MTHPNLHEIIQRKILSLLKTQSTYQGQSFPEQDFQVISDVYAKLIVADYLVSPTLHEAKTQAYKAHADYILSMKGMPYKAEDAIDVAIQAYLANLPVDEGLVEKVARAIQLAEARNIDPEHIEAWLNKTWSQKIPSAKAAISAMSTNPPTLYNAGQVIDTNAIGTEKLNCLLCNNTRSVRDYIKNKMYNCICVTQQPINNTNESENMEKPVTQGVDLTCYHLLVERIKNININGPVELTDYFTYDEVGLMAEYILQHQQALTKADGEGL